MSLDEFGSHALLQGNDDYAKSLMKSGIGPPGKSLYFYHVIFLTIVMSPFLQPIEGISH